MNKIKFIFNSLIDFIIYCLYNIYFKLSKAKKSNVWLISERGIDARDNGYWFYKYMIENHPEVPVKYVISKNSADYNKIRKEDVVEYRSKNHYYYFLYAKYLISAEIMGISPNEQLYYRLVKYGIIKLNGYNIFLQHGITNNYIPYMNPENTKLDLFTCGAIPEQKYMIEKYGYNSKVAINTGFARFDRLQKNCNKKFILIMPTFRKWLKYSDSLVGTEFYNNYNKILNDDEIIKKIEEKNYKLIFYPHIIFQKFVNEFKSDSDSVIIAPFEKYDVQQLLKDSNLLITDYSSVAFDFAYMGKKTIYFQFDIDEYRKKQYIQGYYHFDKDGFGPTCSNYEDLKNLILNYLDNENIYNSYDERIRGFFGRQDKENCKRIYEEIIKLN